MRRLDELIGPIVYRREIDVMSGDWLAEYETRRIVVDLSAEQRAESFQIAAPKKGRRRRRRRRRPSKAKSSS